MCVSVLCLKAVCALHVTREADAYMLLVRRNGQKEGGEKLYGEKGVGFDRSENESNLTGLKKCENE